MQQTKEVPGWKKEVSGADLCGHRVANRRAKFSEVGQKYFKIFFSFKAIVVTWKLNPSVKKKEATKVLAKNCFQ